MVLLNNISQFLLCILIGNVMVISTLTIFLNGRYPCHASNGPLPNKETWGHQPRWSSEPVIPRNMVCFWQVHFDTYNRYAGEVSCLIFHWLHICLHSLISFVRAMAALQAFTSFYIQGKTGYANLLNERPIFQSCQRYPEQFEPSRRSRRHASCLRNPPTQMPDDF